MTQQEPDPAASTDRFRAFVDGEEAGQAKGSTGRGRSAAAGVVSLLVLVAVAVVLWLLLAG